jgi:hypothetical protein
MLGVSKSTLFTFSDPWICEFRTAQNTESFVLLFFHSRKVHQCLSKEFFLLIFLQLSNAIFGFWKKNTIHVARATKPHTLVSSILFITISTLSKNKYLNFL